MYIYIYIYVHTYTCTYIYKDIKTYNEGAPNRGGPKSTYESRFPGGGGRSDSSEGTL